MSWWKALFDRFARTYAWRDARGSLAWLPILVPAPAIGVAAIVAVSSFGADVERAIDAQGKELLGADLRLQMSGPIEESLDALVRERAGDDLRDAVDMLTFTSMAVFVDGGGTRLVQVRATGAEYPFYGTLETTPASAADVAVRGRGALVDSSLLSQAGASIGSLVKIGSREYEIVGALDKVPGESANEALFGPRVFVPLEGIDDALLARGSRVSYRRFYALDDGVDADAIADAIQEKTDGTDVRVATVRTTQENFGRQLRNLRSFLQLVGFVALILGGLGAGSAMLIHLRGKLEAAATLRCLGARARASLRRARVPSDRARRVLGDPRRDRRARGAAVVARRRAVDAAGRHRAARRSAVDRGRGRHGLVRGDPVRAAPAVAAATRVATRRRARVVLRRRGP
jgi:putative ABC transport system permease protein